MTPELHQDAAESPLSDPDHGGSFTVRVYITTAALILAVAGVWAVLL